MVNTKYYSVTNPIVSFKSLLVERERNTLYKPIATIEYPAAT